MKFNIFELGTFSFNSYVYYLTGRFITSSRTFNLLTCAFNLATRAFSLLARGFEPVTRGFELVTRNLYLVFYFSTYSPRYKRVLFLSSSLKAYLIGVKNHGGCLFTTIEKRFLICFCNCQSLLIGLQYLHKSQAAA